MFSLRILAVDDEEGPRLTLEMILLEAGHEVTAIADPRQALGILRSASYDLVITDRGMPGLPGDELALAIRAHFPLIPVLMLTATGHQLLAEQRKPFGVDRVLGKPVRQRELLEAVEQLVEGGG